MEQIVLKADINVCEISGWQSNTGEVKVRDLQVDLCEELSNCGNAFVTFKLADGTVYESKVKDGKADIPVVDKPQFVEIGVYTEDTVNGECAKRYSPHPVSAYINNGSYSSAGTEPPIPTPGTFEELLKNIADLEKGTIKTINSPNIWELDAGLYCTTGNISYSETGMPINFMKNDVGVLIVSIDKQLNGQRNFFVFIDNKICFGYSVLFGGLKVQGELTGEVSSISCEISPSTKPSAIPTAGAVVDYVNETIGGIENGSY